MRKLGFNVSKWLAESKTDRDINTCAFEVLSVFWCPSVYG